MKKLTIKLMLIMKNEEFHNTLEIEKAAESMRQNRNRSWEAPSEQPRNRARPWMKNMLAGTDRQGEIDRLCELEDNATEVIPWDEFDERELWYLLKARPDFASNCPLKILHNLSPEVWLSLLLDFPLLAKLCPHIQQLSAKDWRLLVTKHPQLSHRRPHPDCW